MRRERLAAACFGAAILAAFVTSVAVLATATWVTFR